MESKAVNKQPTNNEEEIEVEELDPAKLPALIEALLFASGEPLDVSRLKSITKADKELIQTTLDRLVERYQDEESGFELRVVAEKYQLRTKEEFGGYLRELRAGRPRKLSKPALETLAIIAYRQPIVKSDIEKIRGVDVTPTLKTVLDRKLVKIVGHKATVGQPALYGTTEEFLKLFGLESLSELPTLRDIRELEDDPGENEDEEEGEGLEAAESSVEKSSEEVSSGESGSSSDENLAQDLTAQKNEEPEAQALEA